MDDKLKSNHVQAEKVFIESFNFALDFYNLQHTSTLNDIKSTVLYPPICVQNGSMLKVLDWVDNSKKEFEEYSQKRNVISCVICMDIDKKKSKNDKSWGEHEKEIKKHKYGGPF